MLQVQVELHLFIYVIYARYLDSFYELYGKKSGTGGGTFFSKHAPRFIS